MQGPYSHDVSPGSLMFPAPKTRDVTKYSNCFVIYIVLMLRMITSNGTYLYAILIWSINFVIMEMKSLSPPSHTHAIRPHPKAG